MEHPFHQSETRSFRLVRGASWHTVVVRDRWHGSSEDGQLEPSHHNSLCSAIARNAGATGWDVISMPPPLPSPPPPLLTFAASTALAVALPPTICSDENRFVYNSGPTRVGRLLSSDQAGGCIAWQVAHISHSVYTPTLHYIRPPSPPLTMPSRPVVIRTYRTSGQRNKAGPAVRFIPELEDATRSVQLLPATSSSASTYTDN